jgi:hypothetical protein
MSGLLLAPGDLRREHWRVRPVALSTAQRMVAQYHYARGGSNTAVACFGLFHWTRTFWDDDCYGVTWWLPPTVAAARSVCADHPERVLALSRMVIAPGAPRNAATFLLARSVKALDARWTHLVTYADEWRGHTGGVYKAANWRYVGRTEPEWVYVRDGRMMGPKRGPVTYSHEEMIAAGYVVAGKYAKHKYVLERAS